jgi:hypothetical protein
LSRLLDSERGMADVPMPEEIDPPQQEPQQELAVEAVAVETPAVVAEMGKRKPVIGAKKAAVWQSTEAVEAAKTAAVETTAVETSAEETQAEETQAEETAAENPVTAAETVDTEPIDNANQTVPLDIWADPAGAAAKAKNSTHTESKLGARNSIPAESRLGARNSVHRVR